MAQQSHFGYVAQYLGFCDGADGIVDPGARLDGAVTETFLHETAVRESSYGDLALAVAAMMGDCFTGHNICA